MHWKTSINSIVIVFLIAFAYLWREQLLPLKKHLSPDSHNSDQRTYPHNSEGKQSSQNTRNSNLKTYPHNSEGKHRYTPIKDIRKTNTVFNPVTDKNSRFLDLSNVKTVRRTVWPIVLFVNGGRTGNCLYTYAVALVMAAKYNVTVATDERKFREITKVFDQATMQLFVLSKKDQRYLTHMDVAQVREIDATGRHWVDIEPAIQKAIIYSRLTSNRVLLIVTGYPNRMHQISRHQDVIRKNLYIKNEFRDYANSFFHKVSADRGSNITYIGFHIRRGDYIPRMNKYVPEGEPSDAYYQGALRYYREKFLNPLFIVASDDQAHARAHLAQEDDVVFTGVSSSVAEDLSTLSLCNASVMTVGSFGWWSGFLTGGPVIYTLYTSFKALPFAHPVKLGPLGFNRFIGITLNGSLVNQSYYDNTECLEVVHGQDPNICYPMCFNVTIIRENILFDPITKKLLLNLKKKVREMTPLKLTLKN